MAKKQVNIGMFERAGYASGQANLSAAGYKAPYDYSKGFINAMVRASQADAAAMKTANLLKKNPNGVEITKLTPGANQQVTDYLISKKPEIDAAKQAEKTGTPEQKQAELLDMSSDGNYAKSNRAHQSMNFHNMANGHMAAGAVVKENENGMPRLMYNTQDASGAITQQVWDTIDVGSGYDNSLYKLIEGDEGGKGFAFDILNIAGKTAVQKNPELWSSIHKPKMIKQVKNILKNNPNAAKDLMFQEDDFAPILNGILVENYQNLPTGSDGQLDEESVEYKAAIEELKGDGFKVNNDYFLEQLGIMFDEDFEKASGGVAKKIKINF